MRVNKSITLTLELDDVDIEKYKHKFVREKLKGHVIAIIKQNEKVLLIRRKKSKSKNNLCLPGGDISTKESYKKGLEREMKEELGIQIINSKIIAKIKNCYCVEGITKLESSGYIIEVINYLGDIVLKSDEVDNVEWCDIHNPPKMKFENDKILKFLTNNMQSEINLTYKRNL